MCTNSYLHVGLTFRHRVLRSLFINTCHFVVEGFIKQNEMASLILWNPARTEVKGEHILSEIRQIGSIRRYLCYETLKPPKRLFPLLFSLGLIIVTLSFLAFLGFCMIQYSKSDQLLRSPHLQSSSICRHHPFKLWPPLAADHQPRPLPRCLWYSCSISASRLSISVSSLSLGLLVFRGWDGLWGRGRDLFNTSDLPSRAPFLCQAFCFTLLRAVHGYTAVGTQSCVAIQLWERRAVGLYNCGNTELSGYTAVETQTCGAI